MAPSSPLDRRFTVALLLALTGVTGLVDAVSYLRLGHVFVANMTGNVIFLGLSVAPRSGLTPAASLIALGGFIVGAVAGGRGASRWSGRPRTWLVASFAAQGAVMALVALLFGVGILSAQGGARYAAIAVLAAALGLQNSTVRHLGAPDLTTTVLTQTLTGLAADSFLAHGPGARVPRRLGSVAVMLAGTTVGAALLRVSASAVLAVAAVVVVAVAVGFLVGPPERPPRQDIEAAPPP